MQLTHMDMKRIRKRILFQEQEEQETKRMKMWSESLTVKSEVPNRVGRLDGK